MLNTCYKILEQPLYVGISLKVLIFILSTHMKQLYTRIRHWVNHKKKYDAYRVEQLKQSKKTWNKVVALEMDAYMMVQGKQKGQRPCLQPLSTHSSAFIKLWSFILISLS